jgi:hypothetical protein
MPTNPYGSFGLLARISQAEGEARRKIQTVRHEIHTVLMASEAGDNSIGTWQTDALKRAMKELDDLTGDRG